MMNIYIRDPNAAQEQTKSKFGSKEDAINLNFEDLVS